MKARDVMVAPAITVRPHSTVKEVAKTLVDRRISAVPVVDDAGKLVGIISEGDLMHRAEMGTERRLRVHGRFGGVSNREVGCHEAEEENRHDALPALPVLQQIIDASPCGDLTFLVNKWNRPFTDAGFGNRFREWCDEAGLQHCFA